MTPARPPSRQPLDAARLRHERGRECLRNVEAALDAFAVLHDRGSPIHGQALAYQDAVTGEWLPLPWYATAPLEVTFGMSEMLYNLKVSLDYVTYALFKQALSAGRISRRDFDRLEKGVQFPIMDTPQQLRAWRSKHWQWLQREERAIIRRAQPYRRPLMRFLGDSYHNLDKHRDLQTLVVEVDLSRAIFRDTRAITASSDLEAEPLPAGRPVAVYVHGSVEVLLPDRTPLVETLKVLESEVAALIYASSLAFK